MYREDFSGLAASFVSLPGSLCILNGLSNPERKPSENYRFPSVDLRTEISRG